jgi:hypothetical protein
MLVDSVGPACLIVKKKKLSWTQHAHTVEETQYRAHFTHSYSLPSLSTFPFDL